MAGPLLVSLVFILAGVLYLTLSETKKLGQFQMWRLCFFLAVRAAALEQRGPVLQPRQGCVPGRDCKQRLHAALADCAPACATGCAPAAGPADHLVDWAAVHERPGVGSGANHVHVAERALLLLRRAGARSSRACCRGCAAAGAASSLHGATQHAAKEVTALLPARRCCAAAAPLTARRPAACPLPCPLLRRSAPWPT